MGDRSGGREVKGASLKKSKKNPGGVNARGKKAEKVYTGPAESAATPSPGAELYIDCGAALLSRQFERDRDRVLERARTDGNVAAIVLWFADIEKQQLLADVCKDNSGLCYNVIGVHPDNVDKTNKRSHESWMTKVEELARKPECVGILSGYNLGRDLATHFAQETLLKTSLALCDKLQLPLVLHIADGDSLLKCIEILKAEGWTTNSELSVEAPDYLRRVILHDALTSCGGDVIKMNEAVKAGMMCSVSAVGITDPDEEVRTKSRECVSCIPPKQLLVCSDSPWRTPQNLPDTYLRTLRNEPSNLPSIVEALSQSLGKNLEEFGVLLRTNSIRTFGMGHSDTTVYGTLDDDCSEKEEGIQVKRDVKGRAHKVEDNSEEHVSKGKKKSKAALLQIFAANDKKKKEKNDTHCASDSDSEENNQKGESRTISVRSSGSQSLHFSCHKCRAYLFLQTDVLNHAIDATRTIFKVGEEGLCKSSIFLSYPFGETQRDSGIDATVKSGAEIPDTTQPQSSKGPSRKEGKKLKDVNHSDVVSISGSGSGSNVTDNFTARCTFNVAVCGVAVECGECGIKLGRFSPQDSPCSCGILVPGPALRITATKVDFVDNSIDAHTLAARSLKETEKSNFLDDSDDENNPKGNKKDKKKKMKSDNKGNFSSYRNKSFVKNASRVGKDVSGDEEDDGDDVMKKMDDVGDAQKRNKKKKKDKQKKKGGKEDESDDDTGKKKLISAMLDKKSKDKKSTDSGSEGSDDDTGSQNGSDGSDSDEDE